MSNSRCSIQFPPPALAVMLPQVGAITNPNSGGDRLDAGDLPDDLKVHRATWCQPLTGESRGGSEPPNVEFTQPGL
jgi:hypothetical protein